MTPDEEKELDKLINHGSPRQGHDFINQLIAKHRQAALQEALEALAYEYHGTSDDEPEAATRLFKGVKQKIKELMEGEE